MAAIESLQQEFMNYVKKMGAYNEAISLMYWDLRTGAPKKAVEQRSEVIGALSADVFAMSTSDDMASFIAGLSSHKEQLDEITVKTLEECQREYEKNKRIPAEEYKAYVILQSKAESVWEEARETDNFALFQPYLEEIVATLKRFIQYYGEDRSPYDTLLNEYEPGMTVEILDEVFSQVRGVVVPLVQKIQGSSVKIDGEFIKKSFAKEEQKEFSLHILRELGYDFEAGRLDETVHPFAIGINPGDVRVTTRYNEHDFREAIFGTIHEAGHALYEQNISPKLTGTPLATGTSMGIHESQSLFYENFIGRNPGFWRRHFAALKDRSPEQFEGITYEQFMQAINESKPSLIRVDADELTYTLHVMVRYEIEKGLFNGELTVAELPHVWNEKYREYLGVVPENDREGVLQDVHWAGGSFGYFPSYALGYMYAAQFRKAMEQSLPDVDQLIADGNVQPILDWLTEHVHQHGKMKKPLEILNDATGEGLNATYLTDYLTEKYGSLYEVK